MVRVLAALLGPMAAGVAMSYGQTYLPEWAAPLANSAAPVVLVSVATAFAALRLWANAVLGALDGPLTMLGYFTAAMLRGFGVSSFWVLFWCTAGVLAGAAVGSAVWRLRRSERDRGGLALAALAAGLIPGVLLGEAAHGLARIADTTPVGYWRVQAAVGIVMLAVLMTTRLSSVAARVLAVASAGLIGLALFVTYGVL